MVQLGPDGGGHGGGVGQEGVAEKRGDATRLGCGSGDERGIVDEEKRKIGGGAKPGEHLALVPGERGGLGRGVGGVRFEAGAHISKESGAMMQMRAYDSKGRLMKEFKVRKAQKYNKAYILKQMRVESYNVDTNKVNGRTYLEIADPD